ncbi:phosphate ABC transporter substrate-binding protein PstS [Frigoriglobus tundricola]|uniref:Phosphate-binding protein n=1 Tax=Frigoriglobus tundricola TaxID=2774151 RepID=A0A6M5Z496_9BACT|nr:phosphate ABC transporter substrate-binding protein PstS [Frigoriglobus tundricola]QJX00916.1 Phosphate ABC transporter, substrate-binding protein PstS [Frigoriglobus tundricola]
MACSPNPEEVTLQGSGATFPAPLYKRWFLEIYRSSGDLTRINYQAIGSGAGTRQFREGLTDFGASDDVKKDDLTQIAEARKSEAMALPMTAGTIVLAHNVPPLAQAGKVLLLTRANLIDILLGEITKWNDVRLTTLNASLRGYEKDIMWVRRSDGSGTTAAFTKHLAAIDPKRWTKELTGKAPDWPVPGIGAKGNDGVSAIIGQTPGTIGYVEFGYAGLSKLAFAAIQNKHGEFVRPKRVVDPNDPAHTSDEGPHEGPTPDQIALGSAKLPPDFLISVADPATKNAYPIATYTWMLVVKDQRSAKAARALGDMLVWGLTQGQQIADRLDYVPLPEAITRDVLAAVRRAFPGAGSAT